MATLALLLVGAIAGLIFGAAFWIMEWNYIFGAIYVFVLMALILTGIRKMEK
jgi:hypothetical protein